MEFDIKYKHPGSFSLPLSNSSLLKEAALQKDNPLFRNILDKLPIGAYSCDSNGLITYFNPAAKEIWGRSPKLNDPADKYHGAKKLLHTDGREIPIDHCFVARTLKDEVDYSGYEMIVEQPDGKQLNVLGYANPMFDDSGKLTGVVSILVDFTYQKMEEEEKHKKEKRKLYSKKLESLGILASGVAHNLNNMLTSIMGNTNLAMLEIEKDTTAYNKLLQVEESAEAAAKLSKRMLAYSGKGKFIVELIKVDDLIRNIVSKNDEVVFEQATIKLHLEPANIIGDVGEISQMINALVINAIEALKDQPGEIFINTGTRFASREDLESPHFPKEIPTGNYAYITVRDSGEGMDEETLSKVFDPFFSTKFTGRGLGLAAALGVVSGHSGVIQVESTLNQGSIIEVLLPTEESTE